MTDIMSTRIAVAGASGRMGQMLIEAVRAADDCELSGALDVAASPAIGSDAMAFLGQTSGVAITAELSAGLKNAHALIDFTRPEAVSTLVTVHVPLAGARQT